MHAFEVPSHTWKSSALPNLTARATGGDCQYRTVNACAYKPSTYYQAVTWDPELYKRVVAWCRAGDNRKQEQCFWWVYPDGSVKTARDRNGNVLTP